MKEKEERGSNEVRKKTKSHSIYVKKCKTCGIDFEVTKEGQIIGRGTVATECGNCKEKKMDKEIKLAQQKAEKEFQEKHAMYIGAKITEITSGEYNRVFSLRLVTKEGKPINVWGNGGYDGEDCFVEIE